MVLPLTSICLPHFVDLLGIPLRLRLNLLVMFSTKNWGHSRVRECSKLQLVLPANDAGPAATPTNNSVAAN